MLWAANWGEDRFGRVEEALFGDLEGSGCEQKVRQTLVVDSGRLLLIITKMMEVVQRRNPSLSNRI